jgi:hypothetical protein
MMIDRLLYAATAIALACVVVLDPAFSTNLLRAVDGVAFTIRPLNLWQTGAAGALLGLAIIAVYREWRR